MRSTGPLVSIIVPAYNSGEFISKVIDSALNQTYRNAEIVVVDDGSTDNTREILDPYIQNRQIRYFYHSNAGHGAARNRGIEHSRGEFICFLDHDDLMIPDSVESRLSAFEKYPGLEFVFTDCRKVFVNDIGEERVYRERDLHEAGFLHTIPDTCIDEQGDGIYIFNRELSSSLLLWCFIWIGAVMIRKGVFEKAGLFDESLRVSPDYDLWIRISFLSQIGFLDKCTAIYRTNSGSMSKNQVALLSENIKIREKYLKGASELEGSYRKKLKDLLGTMFFSKGYLLMQSELHKESKHDFVNSIKYSPLHFRSYVFLLLSLLPDMCVHLLRKGKEYVGVGLRK